jgi:hypothetical protein
MHPSIAHDYYHQERHADLLRAARAGELAAAIGESRRTERRAFLARLWHKRPLTPPAPQPL